jgi:hypothetical protein
MTLKDWEQRNKWLTVHTPTRREIADLLDVGARELRDSQVGGLSADARLSHAYNAALQFASAALAAAGYRPARGGDHHVRVIQALELTIGWDAASIGTLDVFRKKRNVSSYERAGNVSDASAAEAQKLAQRLRGDLIAWLEKTHPELI